MLDPCMALNHSGSPHIATFHDSLTELDRVTALLKEELSTTSPARWLTDLWVLIQFLTPLTTMEVVEKAT
jgi:hypothetical protein